MNLKTLKCPNCGAALEIEDGIDTFFCKYCGYKIILEGQSDEAYKAKVEFKKMEHEEKILDKKHQREREKEKEYAKEERRENLPAIIAVIVFIVFIASMVIGCNIYESSYEKDKIAQEEKLNQIVQEVDKDIENNDFSSAYVKAGSIVFDGQHSDEKKWKDIQKQVNNKISEAEKAYQDEQKRIEKEEKKKDSWWYKWFN